MREEELERRIEELESLLRERIDNGPQIDSRLLANYPDSWEYRARAALGEYQEDPQPGQFSLYDNI